MPDHSSRRLLRSAAVLSARRSSSVRSMTPTKPRGGVIAAPVSSPTESRHVFGPTGVPVDTVDPGARPPITTAASAPTSEAETANLAVSSACCGRAVSTLSRGDAARDDAASRDFRSPDCGTSAGAAAGEANGGSADWSGRAVGADRSDGNPCLDWLEWSASCGGEAGGAEPNWYPMTPTAVNTATPASRLANPYFTPVEGGGGGSGSRWGASASLLRSSTAATSPTNGSRRFDRFQGSCPDSGTAFCGAASPSRCASAGVRSGAGRRTFFGA